jgi:hypothetical protein
LCIFPSNLARLYLTRTSLSMAAFCLCLTAAAQNSSSSAATGGLPDAPSASLQASTDSSSAPPSANGFASRSSVSAVVANSEATARTEASRTDRHIQPGQIAPSITLADKVAIGARGVVSPFAITGWFAAAGYEQVTNTSPNWGTDRGAFGERVGTGALRAATEGLLSNSIMAPILHEDPRYYRLGPSHNVVVRTVYAITRPLLTRTDRGRTTVNLSLLSGNLEGSALTNVYYPEQNRGGKQTFETFAGSLKGSAFGDFFTEFFGGYFLRLTH